MSSQSKTRLIILTSGIAATVIGLLFVMASKGPIADAGASTIHYYDQAYLISGTILLIVGGILLILVAYHVGKIRFSKRIA